MYVNMIANASFFCLRLNMFVIHKFGHKIKIRPYLKH